MRVDRFLKFLPVIEERVAMAKLDCVVLGLGPTGWLVPHMRQSLFAGVRFFGPHDVFRIRPVDDLVVMDRPVYELNQDSERYGHIVRSRPPRLWFYDLAFRDWRHHLPPDLLAIANPIPMHAWEANVCTGLEPFRLEADPIQTIGVSPAGCTTLAWQQGCRRIGVIGVDMMHGHHESAKVSHQVDAFFTKIARQAFDAGGLIVNLSPVTSLRRFALASQDLWKTERVS